MNFSVYDFKKTLYIVETVFGILLSILAVLTLRLSFTVSDGLFYFVPGLALLGVGATCILFGIETYFLRDDPDIWD